MSMPISSNTAGMVNRSDTNGQPTRTNLMEKAVEMARDGLTVAEYDQLEEIAASDQNVTGTERILLDSINQDMAGFSRAVRAAARQSGFEPSNFTWNAASTISVDANGKEVTLKFSSDPTPAKQISGDIGEATRAVESLIPASRQAEWRSLNKHNVADVTNFVNSLNLNLPERASFAQNFMTAYYNHPGLDIEWGGASLQEGIDAVPRDENKRAYLDCEGFVRMAEGLMGGSNMTTYAVASGAEGPRRDHQVAIYRDPNDSSNAYVISNNEVKRVDVPAGATPEQIVQKAYPAFSRVVEDRNGAMKFDTSVYDVGQNLPDQPPGQQIRVDTIDSATAITGTLTRNGSSYGVSVTVNESNGKYTFHPALRSGDVLKTPDGKTINITGSGNPAEATMLEGRRRIPMQVSVSPDGEMRFGPR